MKTKLLLTMFFALGAGNTFAQSDYSSIAPTIPINSTCNYQPGTATGATQSVVPITCAGKTSPAALDVWYKFEATSTTHTITVVPSINFFVVVDLRDGAPGNSIACADASSNGGSGGTETLTATGLTICNTYYIRLYNFGTSTGSGDFNICVTGTGSCGGGSPDLITQNFSMSPNPVNVGANLSISFDMYNQGTATSNSCQTNVRINQSSSTVSGSDPLITSFSTPSLAINSSTTHNYNYIVPSNYSGTYYVWVILDVNSTAGQGAANEANDKSNYALTVVTTGNSDLITQIFSMSSNPVNANTNLTISFEVNNQGNNTSNSCQTNMRINQSSSSVNISDPLIASFTTPSLAISATTTHSTNYTVPSNYLGTYYIWVILDVNSTAGQGATNEANDKSNYLIQIITGINESYFSSQIFIYPNPTSGELIIENNSGLEIEKIETYNMLGQRVQEMSVNKKSKAITINMALLPAGNYNLKITTAKGVINKQVTVEKRD